MKNYVGYGIAALIIVVAVVAWWYTHRTPTLTPYNVTLVAGDTVTSWSFRGAYTGKSEFIQKAHNEIARSRNLLGKEDNAASDYELYVSIANQYDLMGDGANEFKYLEYALALDHDHTGLAWHNVGILLERLGAIETARLAFQKAAAAQPVGQYVNAMQEFNQAHPAP